jgi:hypothetical protein
VCVRPLLRRVTDRETGDAQRLVIPCGSTHSDAGFATRQAHNGSGRLRTFVEVCPSTRWFSLFRAVLQSPIEDRDRNVMSPNLDSGWGRI